MKKRLLIITLILSVCVCASAQEKAIRLLVRGDDMGFSHAGNEALIRCFRDGIERSIEVIVPSPWFPEAVKMLAENPSVDVGIHLAITSEWDNLKWRPLTDCPSLRDADGYFYPMIWPNSNYPGRAIREVKWDLADIEREFRAQIELALKKIPRISHISGHMGCTSIDDRVRELTDRLAAEYKLKTGGPEIKYVGYNGPHRTFEEKLTSFTAMLSSLQPGTYMFVDHPGLDGPELRAIHHIGYEDVAADRDGVTRLWTDERVKALIRERNIRLISYKDL